MPSLSEWILIGAASWTVAALVIAVPTGRCIRGPRPVDASPPPARPAAPTAPTARVMFRTDELLWHKPTSDAEGTLTLGLLAYPGGQLGVLVDQDGSAVGVRLDRIEVQEMRDAITRHLVATSRPVTS